MPTHKRSLIEARLGESLESFLTRRMAAKQGVTNIAREIGVDPATVRYYIKKFKLKGTHIDICLCTLCASECDEKERTHKLGRCVIICVNFREKRVDTFLKEK